MQFQSGVFVLVASVTGVLGAGEEVAVDFGLEDGGDEVGGFTVDGFSRFVDDALDAGGDVLLLDGPLVVVIGDGGVPVGRDHGCDPLGGEPVRVTGMCEVEARPDQFERTSGATTGATGIRCSKGDSALFATAPLIESVDAVARIGRVQEADRVWLGDAAPVLPAAFLGVATMVLDGEGPAALFAAAELVPDNDGRTIARDAISAAVVLPSVLAPGIDTKPAARNSSARTASVRAKRGRTHSLPPSVASQSR